RAVPSNQNRQAAARGQWLHEGKDRWRWWLVTPLCFLFRVRRKSSPQSLLNLSFTLHGRTTRATGGAMREPFPARSGVLPFAVTRIPCPRGLLGRATNPFAPVTSWL